MVSAAVKVGGAPIPMGKTCLRSWKEIAVYAQVSVATVQRWEKQELMPVHRHMHARRGSVYAYTVEIEEWLHRRDTLLAKLSTRATSP